MSRLTVRELINVIRNAQDNIDEVNAVLELRRVAESDAVTRFLNDAKAMQHNFISSMLDEIHAHPVEWSEDETAEIAELNALYRGADYPSASA
ncbi:hypothetical protein ET317_21660 [Salmonella enterica]|nr:hypothetical protein [Salmonella enterica]ECD9309414.1 hypothetical protein [Salmonella enterica]